VPFLCRKERKRKEKIEAEVGETTDEIGIEGMKECGEVLCC